MMESEAEGRDCSSWMEPLPEAESGVRRNSKGDKGRRFSEEQIKSLESMFEAQVKLEPRQKLELARELGLQPRQVAIWFQNKRARWKSKQLEREYRALKTEYDALLASFESLKKEKQILLAQLQTLEELLDKAEERSPDGGDAATKNEERPRLLLKEEPELELAGSADEEDKNLNYLSEEEAALGQPASSSLTLPAAEQQFCFTTSSWPSDQSGGHSHWWEFWPPRG